ncbi:hypothetical protein CLOP_g9185 [Closterium sp. NIES-67]|nr:hypothetical protein CLOP_g9185 [Closterium sp. NIES-67]
MPADHCRQLPIPWCTGERREQRRSAHTPLLFPPCSFPPLAGGEPGVEGMSMGVLCYGTALLLLAVEPSA